MQRSSRSERRASCAVLPFQWLVLSLLAAACSPVPRRSSAPPVPGPTLASESLLAPVRGDADLELEEIQYFRTNPARLRRAWIHVQRNRPHQAVDAVAEVLYGPQKPSPAEEAWARYVRSEAYARMGKTDRAEQDRARARELAFDPELRARLPGGSGGASADAPVRGGATAVLRRASWDPRAPVASRLDPMGRPYRVTIHHSAMLFRDTSHASAAAHIALIQKQHMQQRDFGDIGYHYLVDPAGRVWAGRDLKWQGAHADGANNIGNIGICVLGNFTRAADGQRPPEIQVTALRALLGDVLARYRISPNAIYCHSDFKNTACPGPLMEPVVARLQKELRAGSGRLAAE